MHFTTDVREEGFFTTKEVTKEEIFTAEAQVVRKNPFMLRGPQHEREV
jgi:hypothetical protein